MLLAPMGLADRGRVVRVWRAHRVEVLVVGLISPLAYFLVLTALTFTPVSYVAPAREVSILFGTLMGARLLSEGNTVLRSVAAAAVVVGIVGLALG